MMHKEPADRNMCCAHIDLQCIEKAATSLQLAAISQLDHDMICVECGLSGSFKDNTFRRHFLSHRHFVYARVKQPFELYCCHCGDYQYSDYFDHLIGRKRLRKTLSTVESQRSKKIMVERPQPRAIVNMGATCFMGSVLQVMINNSVILFSKQMRSGKSDLEPCTRGRKNLQSNETSTSSTVGDGGSSNESLYAELGPDTEIQSASSAITSGCIACEFKNLFTFSDDASTGAHDAKGKVAARSAIIPSNLLYSVWSHADYMAGYDQQDAHEFLIALLDGLGSHLEKHHGEKNTSFPRYPSPYEQSSSATNTFSRSNSVTDQQQSSVIRPQSLIGSVASSGTPSRFSLDSPRFLAQSQPQRGPPWSQRGTPRNGGTPRNANKGFRGFVNEVILYVFYILRALNQARIFIHRDLTSDIYK
jgi:Ubiquitin carboxyl-terminal hydrolase